MAIPAGPQFVRLIGCPECSWVSAAFERGEDYCNRAHVAWIVHYMDEHAPAPVEVDASR